MERQHTRHAICLLLLASPRSGHLQKSRLEPITGCKALGADTICFPFVMCCALAEGWGGDLLSVPQFLVCKMGIMDSLIVHQFHSELPDMWLGSF